jgi:catechol 2,3-dioxygenase-like lactoylglutathione lyase family enzyme
MPVTDHMHMPPLAQIGIYVKDLDKSIDRLENLFGIGPWLVLEGDLDDCVYRGRKVKAKGRIAIGYTGKIQLELIHILEGSNMYLDTLGGLEEGIHHLGFAVHNLEERLRACREAGVEVLQRGTLKQLGVTIDFAYLDTAEEAGIILEFIQTRFLGIKVSQSPGLVNTLARMQRRFGFP